MKRYLNQRGMTLVELIVGMAIMVIVISGVSTLFTNLLNHGMTGTAASDLQQDARWAVDMISREVRYATNTPTTPSTNQLNFVNINGENITYAPGDAAISSYSDTLYRRVQNGTANPVTEQTTRGHIQQPTDLVFSVNGQTVTISLTLSKVVGSQTIKETSTTTVTVVQRTRPPISLP